MKASTHMSQENRALHVQRTTQETLRKNSSFSVVAPQNSKSRAANTLASTATGSALHVPRGTVALTRSAQRSTDSVVAGSSVAKRTCTASVICSPDDLRSSCTLDTNSRARHASVVASSIIVLISTSTSLSVFVS